MIEALSLTKRHGSRIAVDDLSFAVPDGSVTGLLGAAGSGKSTVLRMALGLDSGTGAVLFDGVPLAGHARPAAVVGAALDSRAVHPGRTARGHLRVLAAGAGVPKRRVEEVLERVGLEGCASRRPATFWRGAAQRLAVAGALLGRPATLLLDDPADGLDAEGRDWLAALLRDHAAAGGSALLTATALEDLTPSADSLLVLRRGRLVAHGPLEELVAAARGPVLVRASDPGVLAAAVLRWGGGVDPLPDGGLLVTGLELEAVGEVARAEGVAVHELFRRTEGLERSLGAHGSTAPGSTVHGPTDDGLLSLPAVTR